MSFKDICTRVWEWVEYLPYYIKDCYLSTRCWFKVCFNKPHFKLMKQAMVSYPFDFSYIYELERCQLLDMLNYFEHADFITKEAYERKKMQLRRVLGVLDIVCGNVDTFEYQGQYKFIENDNPPNTYTIDNSNVKYICKVKVNLNNINRFVKHKEAIKFYMNHPHEVYELKAKRLYYKLKEHYIEDWWD